MYYDYFMFLTVSITIAFETSLQQDGRWLWCVARRKGVKDKSSIARVVFLLSNLAMTSVPLFGRWRSSLSYLRLSGQTRNVAGWTTYPNLGRRTSATYVGKLDILLCLKPSAGWAGLFQYTSHNYSKRAHTKARQLSQHYRLISPFHVV